MRATEGDQLVQHGRVVGQHDKVAEITQVMGKEGTPRIASGSRTGTRPSALPGPTPRSGTRTPCGSPAPGRRGAGTPCAAQRTGVAGCR